MKKLKKYIEETNKILFLPLYTTYEIISITSNELLKVSSNSYGLPKLHKNYDDNYNSWKYKNLSFSKFKEDEYNKKDKSLRSVYLLKRRKRESHKKQNKNNHLKRLEMKNAFLLALEILKKCELEIENGNFINCFTLDNKKCELLLIPSVYHGYNSNDIVEVRPSYIEIKVSNITIEKKNISNKHFQILYEMSIKKQKEFKKNLNKKVYNHFNIEQFS